MSTRNIRSEHTANLALASATPRVAKGYAISFKDKRRARGVTPGKAFLAKFLKKVGL